MPVPTGIVVGMTSTLSDAAVEPHTASIGGADQVLTDQEIRAFVSTCLAREDLDGRSVCVIVPDGTRSCPLPLLLSAVHQALSGRVSRLTVLVALGTHAAMSEPHLAAHLGYSHGALAATYPGMTVRNHEWWKPETFVSLGSISADRVDELSEGRLSSAGGGGTEPGRRRA